jgi:SecD/SecF fusion protein
MRVLVSIFAGVLILISLYQLSFTWFVNKHESRIEDKAVVWLKKHYAPANTKYPGDKEKQALYQDTLDNALAHYRDSIWPQPVTKKSPGGGKLIKSRKRVNCC